MATVTRENVGLLNDKITVKISKEDYYPSFEKAVKEHSKKANIPGFRKGMVPPGMVKKMYGASLFHEEVIKAVEKEIQHYLTEEKPDIFARPLPMPGDLRSLDMNSPSDYDFPFEIGLKPEVHIPDLKQASVTFYRVGVTEAMINEENERLQTRHAISSDADTITTEDNVLQVRFVEIDSEGHPVENGIVKENSLPVKYFTPLLRDQLIGKIKEDSVQLQLNDAFDDKEREWLIGDLGLDEQTAEGILKNFRLTILKISLPEKRGLDEAFFKVVFPDAALQTAEEFREAIRQEIQAHWDAQSSIQLQDQIYHFLLELPVALPEDFLKKWLERGDEKEKSPEEVEAEFPVFKNQLKWTLISDKLTRENRIDVSMEELKAHFQTEIMRYFGQGNAGADISWMDAYVDRMMRDKKQLESTYRKIITNKLFAWAQNQVNPVEKEITAEELTSMQHNHQH